MPGGFGKLARRRTFGISIEPTWSIGYSVELSLLAERLGFSNIWVPDSGPAPPYSDTIVTLSAIASATSRIKFGSAVLNFYTRNPAWIASSFLTLSDLGRSKIAGRSSGQRAALGLGVGSDWNVAKAGIGERSGRILQLREAIESINELFLGKEVTVRTDSFAIEGVTLSKSRGKIPIYVGTSSTKGLEMAGEIADGLILTDRIPAEVEESMKHLSWGLGNTTRRRRDIDVVNSVVVSVDMDRAKAIRAAKPTCAYLVSWLSNEESEAHQIDLAIKDKISQFIQRGDEKSAASLVDHHMVDLLTASGTPEDCLEKCREYLSYDVDQLAFCEPFGPDQKESLTMLCRKVIPRL
jgi:5,10-methylenetetrahydromethanopterin reductase